MQVHFKRVVCLVADGLGVGAAPDAADYGDEGANTLGHTCEHVGGLSLPNLQKLGLGNIGSFSGIAPQLDPLALVSKLQEKSQGKDTTTGHWEIAGVVNSIPFQYFPQGFPESLLQALIQRSGVPGFLGNKAASGTEIIKELGEEHLRTKKPILYTSADSVLQIAAHEEAFGLEALYDLCETARELTRDLNIGRIIARPFLGTSPDNFKRTEHRKDYSLTPPYNLLDVLSSHNVPVSSVGKIEDIFDHRGITEKNHTGNNLDSLLQTKAYFEKYRGKESFIFTNLVDFDQLYGHRRNPKGFAQSLKQLDDFLPKLLGSMDSGDALILTGDHGCDPTFRGTDHTREYVPFIFYSPQVIGRVIADRSSFCDIAQTILQGFRLPNSLQGVSLL